jgi:predicted RNase H-like nuclease (RuvC/YqgF family)
VKSIYTTRIKSLGKEYKKFKKYAENSFKKVEEYISIIYDLEKEVGEINKKTDIEPNKKYIIINEKLEYIEKISFEMSKIKAEIEEKQNKLVKERDILIDVCLSEHKDLTEKDIYKEIEKYSN